MTRVDDAPAPTGSSADGRFGVRPYVPGADDREWDQLVAASANGTFLHSRRFLSYHGDRFTDRSVVVVDEQGRWRAVLAAAEMPGAPGSVGSHPGITYGGLVHEGTLGGADHLDALTAVASHYRRAGYLKLRYKPVPSLYHRSPCGDDLYSLFRLGADRVRVDLSAAAELSQPRRLRKGRRSQLSVARRNGLAVSPGWERLEPFWDLLAENLESRHGARPVHSADELALLSSCFPEEMQLLCAGAGGEILAGAVLFHTGAATHVQYTACGDAGRRCGALDLVVEAAVEEARQRGSRWFDYGISTESDGRVLNHNLHDFKVSFGLGGVVYEQYEVNLT